MLSCTRICVNCDNHKSLYHIVLRTKTVQTQTGLLLQDLFCLPFHLHLLCRTCTLDSFQFFGVILAFNPFIEHIEKPYCFLRNNYSQGSHFFFIYSIYMILDTFYIESLIHPKQCCVNIILNAFKSPSARYRLKYCLKGSLNPNQPTNQSNHRCCYRILHAFKSLLHLQDPQCIHKAQPHL